jgi:hypothetical protein
MNVSPLVLIAVNESPPATGTGTLEPGVTAPVPSRPENPLPQQ